MNQILSKIFWKNILDNCKHFVFVTIAIILSTALLSGFLTNAKTLSLSSQKYFEKTNLADIWLEVDKVGEDDEQFFSDNKIKFVKRLKISCEAQIGDSQAKANVYVYDKTSICTPYIESGNGYCFCSKNFAINNDLKLNFDEVDFCFDYDYFDGEQTKSFAINISSTLSGTISICDDLMASLDVPILFEKTYFLNLLKGELSNYGEINLSLVNDLPYNEILIDTNNLSEDLQKIESYYNGNLTSNLLNLKTREKNDSYSALMSEVKQSKIMAIVMPIVFLVVSILILSSTIKQLLSKEKYQIGVLKALGANRQTLLDHYSKYGSVCAFCGSILGIIFGLIIPDVMMQKYNSIYSIPSEYVSLSLPLIELLIMVAVMCFVSYFVSYVSVKTLLVKKPSKLLRKKPIFKTKNSEKLKVNYFSAMLKSLKSSFVETICVVFGLAGCTGLFVCAFGITDTISKSTAPPSDLGLNSLAGLIKTFACLLAIIASFNYVLLSLKQKNKDFAVLKVFGYTNKQIVILTMFEVCFVCLFGLFIGFALAYPFLILTLKFGGVAFVSYFYFISPLAFVFALLMMLLIFAFVSILILIFVKRINISKSLKTIE